MERSRHEKKVGSILRASKRSLALGEEAVESHHLTYKNDHYLKVTQHEHPFP